MDFKYSLHAKVVFDGKTGTVVRRYQGEGEEQRYLIQKFEGRGFLRRLKVDLMVNESDLRLPS